MNLPTNRRGLVFNADPFKNLTVGFDSLFDQLSSLSDFEAPSYPPYNIQKNGNKFSIEIAVAGLSKKDINIELADGILSISYDDTIIHKYGSKSQQNNHLNFDEKSILKRIREYEKK